MIYNDRVNIVVASDENYVPHLETLVVSIVLNNKNMHSILIHVLDSGIMPQSIRSIEKLKEKYNNVDFKFYPISEETIAKLLGGNVSKDRSLATYARVFIPNIIDANRALYLDVDAIVVGPLDELFELEMENYAIAGVRDTNPISRHRNVGLTDFDVYINAGMILWNLKKCREIDAVEQCVDFVKNHNGVIDAMDQGTINGVFGKKGLIKLIHPKFNAFTSLFQLGKRDILTIYGLPEFYSDNEIIEARNKPVFVHFTPNMTTRPWVKHCAHPLRKVYWKYRGMTGYGQYSLDADNRSLKLRFLSMIYRNFPGIYGFCIRGKRKE